MTNIPSCFISYCHSDCDHQLLRLLVERLASLWGSSVNILLDKKDVRYGQSFNSFMDLIGSVDAVLLLLTPGYKQKIENRRDGVYTEYKAVLARLQDHEDRQRIATLQEPSTPREQRSRHFSLIPVLVSGSDDTTLPNELRHLRHADFRHIHVLERQEQLVIPFKPSQSEFLDVTATIAEEIASTAAMNSPSYASIFDEYFESMFGKLKSGWREKKYADLATFRHLFVKTKAYERVKNQASCFLVGRKGSGKSTLADVLITDHFDRYLGFVAMNADEFNLNVAHMAFSEDRLRSDFKHVLGMSRCLEMAWSLFFYFAAIDAMLNAGDRIGTVWQREQLDKVRPIIERMMPEDVDVRNRAPVYFVVAFDTASAFAHKAIDTARPEFFFSDIQARFTRTSFIRDFFGEQSLRIIEELLSSLTRKILITMDGFDTAFDRYRSEAIKHGEEPDIIQTRAEFELEWLRALLAVILQVRDAGSSHGQIARVLDFCVALPRDRFLEIRTSERDSYQYNDRYCALAWSGPELAILLRKRLERITGYRSLKLEEKRITPRARLADVWSNKLKHLAAEVEFEHNGHHYRMDTFLYVLRHTFWRPRGVLYYMWRILTLAEQNHRNGKTTGPEGIRLAVRETTHEIISGEFINEFASTIINIKDIVNDFRGFPQRFPGARLSDTLRVRDFKMAIPPGLEGENLLLWKVESLLSIGMLGIHIPDKLVRERHGIICEDAFWFNEGQNVYRLLMHATIPSFTFIIHPIFCEYLSLDTTGGRLVLELTWDYVEEIEAIQHAQPHRWS